MCHTILKQVQRAGWFESLAMSPDRARTVPECHLVSLWAELPHTNLSPHQHWVLVVLSCLFLHPVTIVWIQKQVVWKAISQSHRKSEVGGQLRSLAGSTLPSQSRITLTRLLRAMSRQGLNLFKEEDSTVSLGNLFQYLITMRVKQNFLMFKQNSFEFNYN